MSYRVLIVDDSSVVRTMVRKAASMAGLDIEEVHEAGNGREALELLKSHWVDIVFTDLHMPEMTGIELVEAMARSGVLATTPVVVVSSDPSASRIEELRHLGVRAYLKKPFRPEGFRAIVEEVLHGSKETSDAC
ncbi:MAG TPA: response regulator [Anaeromyxobacteraceae bacterium]|nr:response regulator [Anaeromyxobacteraceae bacterium]